MHPPITAVELPDGIQLVYGRTGGYIVSLSHLLREAAIRAILTGTERIDEGVLDAVGLDHAATEEVAARRQTARSNRKRGKS